MQTEKRKFSRIALPFVLNLIFEDGSVYPVEEYDDISIGGCLIPANEKLENFTHCTVSITLGGPAEGGPKIEIKGKIVRHDKQKMAVQFISIDPDSLFHLQNIIRYNAPDPDQIDDEIQEHKGLK